MAKNRIDLATFVSVCEEMVLMVEKSFGPNALSVMLSLSTGKLSVSSRGVKILQSLHTVHPIGRFIVDALRKHEQYAGDGSKIMIFLLCDILRTAFKSPVDVRMLRQSFVELSHTVLPQLEAALMERVNVVCCSAETGEQVHSLCHHVISTALQGKFSRPAGQHLANCLCQLLADVPVEDVPTAVRAMIDDFDLLCLRETGVSPQSTRVIQGVIIERDFSLHDRVSLADGIVCALVDCSFPEQAGDGDTIVIKETTSMDNALTYHSKTAQVIVHRLQELCVNLLLCAGSLSPALLTVCRDAGISVVQMIPDDALCRLARVTDSAVTYRWCELDAVVRLSTCNPFLLSGRRCVHLHSLKNASWEQHQLIVCGASETAVKEVSDTLLASLKCLLALFTNKAPPRCEGRNHMHAVSIQGGGAFELAVGSSLQHVHCDATTQHTCRLLSEALLTIPHRLLRNSYATDSNRLRNIQLVAPCSGQLSGVDARTGAGFLSDCSDIVEPLAAKWTMLHDLVALLQQLIRLDMIL